MENTPQQIYIRNLSNIIEWYRQHPDAPCPLGELSISIAHFSAKPEELKAIGAGKKQFDDDLFRYIVDGDGFSLRFLEYRSNVCEKVVVGTKIVPATEETIIPAQPEHEEEIFEWKCSGSLLSTETDNAE